MYLLLVYYVSGVDWNPSCMIPMIPLSYTSMYRAIEVLYLMVFRKKTSDLLHSQEIG